MTEPAPLTFVGASTWVAPASSTTVSPTYPTGLVQDDVVYAVLVIKPDTATVATPANWTLVGAQAVGGGTQGAGTGAIKIHVYKRTVPSGGLTGSQAFTITSGSSPVGTMQGWRASGSSIAWDTETLTFYSRTTASTAFGGTGAANLNAAVNDAIAVILGSADDAASTITVTSVTATGATLGTVTAAPTGTATNAQGNDISAAAVVAQVLSGTESAAPAVTATSNSSETGGTLFFRVSATRAIPVTQNGTAAVSETATITVAGAIVVTQTGQASLTGAATILAEGASEAPSPPAPTSAEPGYGQPGAFWVGGAWITSSMGAAPEVEGQAAVATIATVTAAAGLTQPAAATVVASAVVVAAGDWFGQVRGLSATPVSATQIDLDWDATPGALSYAILRDGRLIAQGVTGTMYSDSAGLAPLTSYGYQLAAVR